MFIFKKRMMLLLVCFFALDAKEYIKKYHADITLHKNGEIEVIETIIVKAEGNQIRKGIYRDFPTKYGYGWNRIVVPFKVHYVKRDGVILPRDIHSLERGKRVFMRSGEHLQVPATYTFELHYTTDRQIGFFEDHDEFYWNVIGADWCFRIDEATATVHLPEGVTVDQVKQNAFTGNLGSKKGHYQVTTVNDSTITFTTTCAIYPFQAFTIAIWMPKGSITPPTQHQQWWWSFTDSADITLFIVLLILFLLYVIVQYNRLKNNEPEQNVIPLFEPPSNFTPGMVSYFVHKSFEPSALSSDIVNMAVKGWLTIEYEKGWLWGGTYTLKKAVENCNDQYYKVIFKKLFGSSKKIKLNSWSRDTMASLVEDMKESYKKKIDKVYFEKNSQLTNKIGWLSFFIVLILAAVRFFLVDIYMHPFAFFLIPFVMIPLLFAKSVKTFKSRGFEIKDQIEGFKLYLETAESERFRMIGTPPIKTPELYETFLPYAIALGVEDAWTEQFVPVFDKLAKSGNTYVCTWYRGPGGFSSGKFSRSSAHAFSSAVGTALSSSIGANAPGSKSGFGGGGAGGGGGGGGGGGC